MPRSYIFIVGSDMTLLDYFSLERKEHSNSYNTCADVDIDRKIDILDRNIET